MWIVNYSFLFIVNIISLKLSKPASKFSIMSPAKTSGSGRLSRSASDLSFIQDISNEVLSLVIISSKENFRHLPSGFDSIL